VKKGNVTVKLEIRISQTILIQEPVEAIASLWKDD